MDDLDCRDLDSFMAASRGHGIDTVIIAWQEEYGQRDGQETVVYERLQRLSLLAYHRAGGCIVRFMTSGGAEARAGLRAHLETAGFTVAERNRNVVGIQGRSTP